METVLRCIALQCTMQDIWDGDIDFTKCDLYIYTADSTEGLGPLLGTEIS